LSDSLFTCRNYSDGRRIFEPVIDVNKAPDFLIYYYQRRDDKGEIYYSEINSLTKWARRHFADDKSKANLLERRKLIAIFTINIALMIIGMSWAWLTFISAITSLLISVWLYQYRDYFTWNDKAMFKAMLTMAIIGFVATIPMYIIDVLYLGVPGYGIQWSLAWWVIAQIPSTYPFYIIYLTLSSILMRKMWKFHSKFSVPSSSIFSVASSGSNYYFTLWDFPFVSESQMVLKRLIQNKITFLEVKTKKF